MLRNAMRIIARNRVMAFWAKHPASKASLLHWLHMTKAAQWQNGSDVQAAFSKAKVLNDERVRFEVAGGDFRLIAAFDFRRGIAFVKFIGTHAEYDKVDALSVNLF